MRPALLCLFFFFQAEDGIRDIGVTGVQTCALPISWPKSTIVWTWARARSPEKSSQIFFRVSRCGCVCARSQAPRRPRANSNPAATINIARGARDPPELRMLGFARGQSERGEHALEIVVAVIFDLNAPM